MLADSINRLSPGVVQVTTSSKRSRPVFTTDSRGMRLGPAAPSQTQRIEGSVVAARHGQAGERAHRRSHGCCPRRQGSGRVPRQADEARTLMATVRVFFSGERVGPQLARSAQKNAKKILAAERGAAKDVVAIRGAEGSRRHRQGWQVRQPVDRWLQGKVTEGGGFIRVSFTMPKGTRP
jgi:hypothetical protein